MTDYLLDTDTASRLIRADRSTVNAMRRAGASSISISTVTQSELLYGARLRSDSPAIMAAVRAFLAHRGSCDDNADYELVVAYQPLCDRPVAALPHSCDARF